ncbi:MAG: SH3 domain-containing protein [Pseudomonadota bacterium]
MVVAPMFTALATELGPVTNRPLPRFVSMKASEANVRRGPSRSHRIDWVFKHRGMPLVVTAEYGHWRYVQDYDGLGGWVHYAMLSGTRTALVTEQIVDIRRRPAMSSPITARAEQDVVLKIRECAPGWCRVSTGGHSGWAPSTALWGATEPDHAD